MNSRERHLCAPYPPPRLETNHSSFHYYTDPPIWSLDLLYAINRVINTPCVTLANPEFSFEMSDEVAGKISCILAKYGMDLSRALDAQKNSSSGHGYEFRSPRSLEQVFGYHPIWHCMCSLLTPGSDWPMEELNSERRKGDAQETLRFENHKGACEKLELRSRS